MIGKVVITGSARGIGKAMVKKFLSEGWEVFGLDISPSDIVDYDYWHYIVDVSNADELPSIKNVDVLINNAGVQEGDPISVNLIGTINCTKKYVQPNNIKAVLNMASVSAHNGAEFPEYCASKGGVLSYTVNTAKSIAEYGAVCNSLSFGGVVTELNSPVLTDSNKWSQIMDETPLKKWMSAEECAEWAYFFTAVNKSCTGQDLIIDNGEMINHRFIW